MPIAMQLTLIQQELDDLRLRYRQGRVCLDRLKQLDRQISTLLPQASGTANLLSLQCMQGLVRSMETRIQQTQGQNCSMSDDVENQYTSAVA